MFTISFIIALVMYLFMVITNILAVILPINNITPEGVSLKYPNLFQPSSITFSVWSIIYLLLLVYLIYQKINFKKISDEKRKIYTKVNFLFAISSLLNIIWIFTWHYDIIYLSVIIIILLLITLIIITRLTPKLDSLTRSAFSVYTGWLSIATISNITVLLVEMGVPGFGTIAVIMTVIILLVGVLISCFWIVREKDIDYGIVVFWAYCGILIRHLSKNELNRAYPPIYYTVIISLIVLFICIFRVMKKTK